jgi:uncharacterized protein (DUF2336 family)
MQMSHHTPAALADVYARLRAHPDVAVRTETARQVGTLLSTPTLSASERRTALAILERLVQDVEQEVREALAIHVARCDLLPPDLARKIAEDVDAVALPFLRVSPALSDADLVAIIAAGGISKQVAIAARPSVSPGVTEVLIGTGSPNVVTALLENDGATITEAGYHTIMDEFGEDDRVQRLMVARPALPLPIAERLIAVVSETLRERLVENHALPPQVADELVHQARERALMHGIAALPRSFDVDAFTARLGARGELTPTLLMRALCLGDRRFFEAGMAVLAGISVASSVVLIADRGPLGFKALYEKAGLPPEYFRAFRAALDVLGELQIVGQDSWSPGCLETILDRMMREYDEACPADLEHLMSQMSRRILGRMDRQGRH